MKGFKKFISVVGLTSSLLMVGVSAQGEVQLEPVYLVCVLNHLEIPAGDSELETLQNLEQVNKKSAEAMKMVRRFNFNADYCGYTDSDYTKISQNISKLCPNIETASFLRTRLACDIYNRPVPHMDNIIPVLKDNGAKRLEVHDDWPLYCSGSATVYHNIWDFRDSIDLNSVIRCLENPNITNICCIYFVHKPGEENPQFLAEIQRRYPNANVRVFEWDDYFERFCKNIKEQDKASLLSLCMFYVRYHIIIIPQPSWGMIIIQFYILYIKILFFI